MMRTERIETDVFVIGGGGAGTRAAVEAADAGRRVIVATKGTWGDGSSTGSTPGAYSAAFGHTDPLDSPDEHFRDIVEAGAYVLDQRLGKIIADEAPERFLELEQWGARFSKIQNYFFQQRGCFHRFARICGAGVPLVSGETGRVILSILKKKAVDKGVIFAENIFVVDFLVQDGVVVGALGIHETSGDLKIFLAKATILATGGAGRIFQKTDPRIPEEINGDGFAMAFRAGAALVNMEFFQIGFWAAQRIPSHPRALWKMKPLITNNLGEDFFQKYIPKGIDLHQLFAVKALQWPFTTKDSSKYLEIGVFKEILEGRGNSNDAVYFDVTHQAQSLEDERKDGSAYLKYFLAQGVDIRREPLQITLVAHAHNGGVLINEMGATTLPGLFAAGEAAGGQHGADRLAGNSLNDGQVFGARAGRYAAQRAKELPSEKVSDHYVASVAQSAIASLRTEGIKTTNEILAEIRSLMWRNALVIRTEKALQKTLQRIELIEAEELLQVRVQNQAEAVEAQVCRNAVAVAKVILVSSLTRKETRGPHYREDFPARDDTYWIKMIQVSQDSGKMKVSLIDPVMILQPQKG